MFGNLDLKTGDRVKFKQEKVVRKATVLKEYPYFILLNTGKYRVTVNKASIYCGQDELILIKKGAIV